MFTRYPTTLSISLPTIVLLAFAVLFPVSSHAQVTPGDPGNFITTWNTENTGTSNDDQITIPGTGAGYNYDLYWVNTASSTQTGSTTGITTSSYTITFPEPGIYRVEIRGAFPRIYFNNSGDKDKILTVEQWGDIAWTSMSQAFRGATNLTVPATDAPDLSGVTSMSDMFAGALSFNQPINHWDVSNVTYMYGLFDGWDTRAIGRMSFNQPLDQWDVSKVTNMQAMFRMTDFNQDIETWDVRNVVYLNFLFSGANDFNQPLNNWKTDSLQQMGNIFGAQFNQPLNDWNVSGVTNMAGAFRNTAFNQPLNSWDVSNVTSMDNLFTNAPFNQDISMWDVSNVTSMFEMFSGATAFDQNLANWDVTNVNDTGAWPVLGMHLMFFNAGLSKENLDATLVGWANRPLKSNVRFHLGAKTYSSVGASALNTLRTTYNWDITEQYLLTYDVGPNATLSGERVQQLDSGANGTPVTVVPNAGYQFLGWSDGSTNPTRLDTNITDNRTLTASIEKVPSRPGGNAARQIQNLEEMGKLSAAEALRQQFPGAVLPFASATTSSASFTHPIFEFIQPQYRSMVSRVLRVFGFGQ